MLSGLNSTLNLDLGASNISQPWQLVRKFILHEQLQLHPSHKLKRALPVLHPTSAQGCSGGARTTTREEEVHLVHSCALTQNSDPRLDASTLTLMATGIPSCRHSMKDVVLDDGSAWVVITMVATGGLQK